MANNNQTNFGHHDDHNKRLDQEELRNIKVITTLYEAFNNKKYESEINLNLAPYLEWWYHGPPRHQHLVKRLLTGSPPSDLSFPLVPLSLAAFGATVVAEGREGESGSVSWVHAWTLSADGIVTHVREYYNTSVTVTLLGHVAPPEAEASSSPDIRSQPGGNSNKCQSVWQSKLCDESSVPGLVLAL